jgi:hypothetical protein
VRHTKAPVVRRGGGRTSHSEDTAPGAVGAGIGLCPAAFLVWALALPLLANLTGSDAAGNAYAQAYAALAVIVLWLLLVALGIIAVLKGVMPRPAAVAALILIPASGFVSMEELELLSRPYAPPFLWPIIIPAAVPPLIIGFCFWALLPSWRAAVPARLAVAAAWGATLVLCLSILPFTQMREYARGERPIWPRSRPSCPNGHRFQCRGNNAHERSHEPPGKCQR